MPEKMDALSAAEGIAVVTVALPEPRRNHVRLSKYHVLVNVKSLDGHDSGAGKHEGVVETRGLGEASAES